MKHEYYSYNKEELLKNPKISLSCVKDNETAFKKMAQQMYEEIENNNKAGKHTVMICPVGPVGQYKYFVDEVNKNRLSLKNVWFINMDEYLDDDKKRVDINHPLSFRGFMEKTVYTRIDEELLMPKEQRVFPDPENISHIPELIERLGGVDICFGGIGINGHVAFNEADRGLTNEEFLAQKTRILKISPETITANAIGDFNGAIEDMPKYCVTIGMYEINSAKKIRLGVFRNWHRAVIRRAVYAEPTSEFPVSLLQSHKDINIVLTEFVADLEAK